MTRVHLGTFPGRNRPSDELNDCRAYGWKLFSVFLAVCSVQVFGWLLWSDGALSRLIAAF